MSAYAVRNPLTMGIALLGVVLAAGCNPPQAAKADKTTEVVVTTPVAGDVLDYQDFTGRLDAIFSVDVRARISGYIIDAPFKEGDMVRKGEVLFHIDARTYKADLNQAKANLELAIADRNFQESNVKRARQMIGTKSIGKEEYEQFLAAREKAYANVGATEAARDRAAVYLDYAEVVSPLSGRISRRVVDPGNLIKADDTVLTTVVADQSVYAYFDVDERTYLDLVGEKSLTSSASSARLQDLKFPVLMRLANEEEFTHPGYVDFVDNRLNGNTGTIRLRGVFPNPRSVLKSGLFVRVRLPIGQSYKSLLVPDEALQSDQGLKYVFIVNSKNEVVYRPVTLGQAIDGLRAIKQPAKGQEGKEGIQPGEQVIISGMQRVRAGQQVKAKMQAPSKAPQSQLSKLINLVRQEPAPAPGNQPSAVKGKEPGDNGPEVGAKGKDTGPKGQATDGKGQDTGLKGQKPEAKTSSDDAGPSKQSAPAKTEKKS